MTLEEVSKRFNVSTTSLTGAFPRTQKSILKKFGVHIIKKGRGLGATYEIVEDNPDGRALTMYEETKDDILFDRDSMQLMDWSFGTLLAIVTTPMLVFRGSYSDFLEYIQAKVTDQNIDFLKDALQDLCDNEYISYTIDKTDNNYFVAALYRKKEEQMRIGIRMIRICKEIAEKNNKRSYIPLLKTWVGMQMMAEKEIFKMDELGSVTGLSAYQVRESKRLLEENEIFKTTKAYIDFSTCIGNSVEMNGIYN